MNGFEYFHPTVSALYFASVLFITMFLSNPFLNVAALVGAFVFYAKTKKGICLVKETGFSLLLFVLIAITNPLFSHKGATVLFFFNNNPITLESVLYGLNNAVMLTAVIYWFKCLNLVLTSDKLLYLLGNASPKIALLISSALRFIPLLKSQGERIKASQITMGLYASDAWTDKLKGSLRVCSALITWSLENAIDTGSSMKARGYGLKQRTHYSLYRFTRRDALMMVLVAALDAFVVFAFCAQWLEFSFYPLVSYAQFELCSLSALAAFALLCLLPLIIEIKEDLMWKYCKSRI